MLFSLPADGEANVKATQQVFAVLCVVRRLRAGVSVSLLISVVTNL